MGCSSCNRHVTPPSGPHPDLHQRQSHHRHRVVVSDLVPVAITVTHVSYGSTGALITPTGSVSYAWQVADLVNGEGGIIITISGSYTIATNVIDGARVTIARGVHFLVIYRQ